MSTTPPLAHFVQGFFQEYLAAQRGLSPNTILSYRDALKLFLRFTSQRVKKPADKLVLQDFDEKSAADFLDDLEANRGNCTAARNNRIAALRAFFRYVASQEPLALARCQRICAIPAKRTEHRTIEYLEDKEMGAVLESVDRNSRKGLRDYALLLFLYNTGARVQEIVDLNIADLRLQTHRQGEERTTLSSLAGIRGRNRKILHALASRCVQGFPCVCQFQQQAADHAFWNPLSRAPVCGPSGTSMSLSEI
jgi:site-specific recombinase XerD